MPTKSMQPMEPMSPMQPTKAIEKIKSEFEAAGVSVTQSEPTPYQPQPVRWKDNEEQERLEAAVRDRETLELVNGDGDPGSAAEAPLKVVDPIAMLNDFIRGR